MSESNNNKRKFEGDQPKLKLYYFDIKGKGGHGAYPHATIDPVVIAARLVLDLQTIKFSIPQRIDKFEALSAQEREEMLAEPARIEEFAFSVASGLREMRDQQQTEILRIARANINKKE